jgi:integrase
MSSGIILSVRRTYGTGAIFQRGKIWHIQIRLPDGKRYSESSGSEDEADAKRLLKLRSAEMVMGRNLSPTKVTVADLCDLVVQDYQIRKLRSLKHVIWRIERHIKPALGRVKASECGSYAIRSYVARRQAAGAENSTINRDLAILRRGFSIALHSDPPLVYHAPAIRALPEHNVREGFIEQQHYKALLKELPDRLKGLLVVAYHVGNRKNELLQLRPDQVDLASGEIRLSGRQTKGKAPRTLPIYWEMGAWLEMQLAELREYWPSCQWLFHHQNRPIGRHLVGWTEACVRAGLPGLHFHDLRRSAVRNLERAGVTASDRDGYHRPQDRGRLPPLRYRGARGPEDGRA